MALPSTSTNYDGDTKASFQHFLQLRQDELTRELKTVDALRIAIDRKQTELDCLGISEPRAFGEESVSDQAAFQSNSSNQAHLERLRLKREALYQKVGRSWKGDTKTYLSTHKLHPLDSQAQQRFEKSLQTN
eukprot:m.203275 g.203275  ORF g.203275 m.203275 type:complete len:132 (-) comp32852_c1_seq1:64-459(-)